MADSDATSLKRGRPDEDLYFEDGSVIISANGTGGDLVYFRVHKSVLSKQSTVFKDMLSLPSPPEMDKYDDLPLVHVHDNAEEFKHFLQSIYDPSFLPFLRLGPNTPALVLGPLKLAKKYQADVLRDRITAHLSNDCPTTLQDWDEVAYPTELDDSDPSKETSSQSNVDNPDYLAKNLFPDSAPYLILAHECDLPVIFATLLYSLCRDSTTRKEKLSRMTREDVEKLFFGKDRMIWWISGQLEIESESWIPKYGYRSFSNETKCQDQQGCYPSLLKAWSKLLQDVVCHGDPLATFRATALKYRKYMGESDHLDHTYDYDGQTRYEICVWCKDKIANKLDGLRQDLFDELPSFFPLKDE